MLKKFIIYLVLVSYSAMANAGLLDFVAQTANMIDSTVKMAESTVALINGQPIKAKYSTAEQRERAKIRAAALAKHQPTTKMPWTPAPPSAQPYKIALKKEFDQQLQLASRYAEAQAKVPFSVGTPAYTAKDLALEGLDEFDPSAKDAADRIARFKKSLAEIKNADPMTLTLEDYERVNEDILPVLRFLKHYKDAYDPVVVAVAPNTQTSFSSDGYCLDENLSAPPVKSGLKMVPVATRVAPRIQYLYDAVNRLQFNSKAADQNAFRKSIQNTLWAIRHAKAPIAGSAEAKILKDAWPNGDQVLKKYSQGYQAAIQDHKDLIGAESEIAKSEKTVSVPYETDWDETRAISEVGSGLLTKATNPSKKLSSQISLINPTAMPVFLDTTQFVAEPSVTAQTVSIVSANSKRAQPSVAEKGAVKGLVKYIADLGLADNAAYKNWSEHSDGMFQAISYIMGNVPILGNCMNAYTVATGCDFVTGEKVEGLDYVMAAAGVVPGAQYLT